MSSSLNGCTHTNNSKKTESMEYVDSYVYKNESRPVYYAKYGNRGCLFELRVNDILITEMTKSTNIGEALITINPTIFKSGRQT